MMREGKRLVKTIPPSCILVFNLNTRETKYTGNMTAGYYLSTSWSQQFHQISLVCSRKAQTKPKGISLRLELCQSNDYHNSPICFCLSVEFPAEFLQHVTTV